MAAEVEPSQQLQLQFVAMQQTVAEGQSDKMMSDTGLQMKQRCVTELLHVEKKWHPLTFLDA